MTPRRLALLAVLAAALVLSLVGTVSGASSNPIAGAKLYVDPSSNAARQAREWSSTRPDDARQMEKVASISQADWFTGGTAAKLKKQVAARTAKIAAAGSLSVYVVYDIPGRDCGQYSAGGANGSNAYKKWINAFAAGVGKRKVVVVLEPDALPGMDCLTPSRQTNRLALMRYAVGRLTRNPKAVVYLDAGTSAWQQASVMASRLRKAGVARARGFSLNVSNFQTTESTIAYGSELSRLIGGKRFVIDTSRNGLGPWNEDSESWCNPPGRALGARPSTDTASPLVDAYLWIKRPGESDGTCRGGPPAGRWWPEYALGLAQRAAW
jgi:endoglucanase